MTANDPIEALRARIATLTPSQRAALRTQLEARGIAWERVEPVERQLPRPDRLPLSPAQLHFWILQQIHPESSANHIAFAWHIDGGLNAAALEASFRYLLDRHEPLRTCFPSENGVPWQEIRTDCPFTLEQTDLRGTSDRLEDSIRPVVDTPFELTTGPMLRARLFQLEDQRYCLAINLHHIIADGWSRGILIRELAACYQACISGNVPVLPPLLRHFADLVVARQTWLESADCAEQKDVWRHRLAGLAEQELPSDRAHGSADRACATVIRALPASLSREAKTVSAQLGATPFMLLLAVFKLLLHRYTGEHDLAVGVPVAGRREPEAAGLIGLFVNTLVLRTAVQPDMGFDAWLTRVRAVFADAFEHQDIPFAQVVDALGVERNAGRNPLFQVLFQVQTEGYGHQNAETIDLGGPGLVVRQEMLPLREAKFDLSWHIMERAEGLSLAVEYRTGLFDADRIGRMIGHFEHLLGSVLKSPEERLSDLEYVPERERNAVSAAGMGEVIALPDLCVQDLISKNASRAPNKTALIFGGKALSYRDIEERANQLARRLAATAVAGARIGVCLPRDTDLPIAILAVLKAGMTYVPLDPDHPIERLSMIMEDADVSLVLARDTVLGCGRATLGPSEIAPLATDVPLPASDASRTAYLIYTSGSTGRPKGVPIRHSSLSNLLAAMSRRPGMTDNGRLLAVTTVAFDIAGLELLLPLITGATIVLADRDTVLAPEALMEAMERHDITHMQATPALWRLLLNAGWNGRPQLTALCGGEALDAALATRLLPRVGALWNVYGPTETTIWSGALQVEPRHLDEPGVRIGGPIDNTQFHVLDTYRHPVPFGIPGELFISGAGLSPGYWQNPALTAAAFFDRSSGMRIYKTGDRVSRRADGEMEFLGRTDHQVKLRGYRIETGEIENLLQAHPDIAQALVVLDAHRERLVAYCTLKSGTSASGDIRHILREQLTQRLPRYMVPSAFIILDTFPLNTNGKVDRKRLPLPEDEARPVARLQSPQNDQEEILLRIWRQVLHRDDIGVDDNFFDAGGDSISGMQIVARAKGQGLTLEPAQIFEHQTVRAQVRVAKVKSAAPLQFPLSHWQRFGRQQEHAPWLVVAPVEGDARSVLARAVATVSSRHSVLGFRLKENWWTAEAGNAADLGEDVTDAALIDWADAIKGDGPLWQVAVYGAIERQKIALAAHPLLLDGQSMTTLSAEIGAAITGLLRGIEPAVAGTDFYPAWLNRAEGMTRPIAPVFDGEAVSSPRRLDQNGGPVNAALDAAETQNLLAKAGREKISAEMLVLAALSGTLLQWSGKNSLQTDLLTSSRSGQEHRHTLGNFSRLLPVVLAPSRGSVLDAAVTMSGSIAGIAGQGLDPASGPGGLLFSWLETLGDDRRWLSVPEASPPPGYAISISVRHQHHGLTLDWHYDPARLHRATVERLAMRHLAELTSMQTRTVETAPKLDRFLTQLKHRKI